MEVPEFPDWTKNWAKYSNEIFDDFAFNGYSDATICCDGKRIPVHKIILVSASDYFKEILDSTTASHPIIIIENVELKVLEMVLMFIYRGEIIVHSSETPALFKLAKDFKIKGLSGRIGADSAVLYESKPPGMEVVNLNMFRKHINPCVGQSDDHLCFQINQIIWAQKIYENRRRRSASVSPSADHVKANVVKDNKYKSVVRSRTCIYKGGSVESLTETKDEEEICSQLGKIALVKDTSKTFSDEAVKNLVVRLNSNLSIHESDEEKDGEDHVISEAPPTGSNTPSQDLPSSSTQIQEINGNEPSNSSQALNTIPRSFYSPDESLTSFDTMRKKLWEIVIRPDQPYFRNLSTAAKFTGQMSPSQGKGGELKSLLDEQRTSSLTVHHCDECEFETTRDNIFFLHRKFHAYEKMKYKYYKLKEAKLEEYLRRKAGLSFKNPQPKSLGTKSEGREDRCEATERRVDRGEATEGRVDRGEATEDGTEPRPSRCKKCNIEFENDDELISHLSSHSKFPVLRVGYKDSRSHDKKKKRAYICLFCSYRAYDIQSLNEHRKSHISKKLLSCELCPKRTAKPCPHKLTSGLKILKCHQCSYRCTSPKMLVVHTSHKHEQGKDSKKSD